MCVSQQESTKKEPIMAKAEERFCNEYLRPVPFDRVCSKPTRNDNTIPGGLP